GEELDRYFAETEREKFTPSTVTTEKALRKDIAEVRRTGFAVTDEEYSLGIRGIGRVVTIGGEAVGSLSVGVPKARFDETMQRRAMDLLERTAGVLEAGRALAPGHRRGLPRRIARPGRSWPRTRSG